MSRRFIRSEKALQTALRQLIQGKGFQSITVVEIADRADVAKKTFYAHYPNKHALLEQTMQTIFDEIIEQMGQINPETLLLDGKPLSYPIFKHIQDYKLFYREMFSEEGSTQFILRVWTYIAQASYSKHSPLRAIAPHMTVEPELIAEMLAGAALGAVRWWLSTDMKQTPEAMAYTFSQIMAPGILASMGLDG